VDFVGGVGFGVQSEQLGFYVVLELYMGEMGEMGVLGVGWLMVSFGD
jgi:hypothetical protein